MDKKIECKKCNTRKPLKSFYKKYKYSNICNKCSVNIEGRMDKPGYIYFLSNPAWLGYIKIGRTINVSKRLDAFQTSCPHRDYEMLYYEYFKDMLSIEAYFNNRYEHKNEWFNITIDECLKAIDMYKNNKF